MPAILDVFEYELTTNIFEYASFAILIAYTTIAFWMMRQAPARLPVNLIRRAI